MWRKKKVSSDTKEPLTIHAYRGYASPTSIFLKGRILEDRGILKTQSQSAIRNFIKNFKRFETDEVPGVEVQISIEGRDFKLITDREGYFTLDEHWDFMNENNASLLDAKISIAGGISKVAEVFHTTPEAEYGIITDIDDTVLKTNVTSLFKLKMLYATFFKDAHQRMPMEGIVNLFSKFTHGSNPIFYISHSPWNIYDLLVDFMEMQELPKGPILLRDYGIKPVGHFSDHKIKSITRILKNHPDLPFIMLGDTAAEDADLYIKLAHDFPDQIKAIYIRQTKNNKNARRIKSLIEEHSGHQTDVILSESSEVMMEHALEKGLIT
ncbi:App1 family protein [Portibacter lacus]|uniref:Phosphatidate phosphatase APP1 catalytic domain-containing protein n=1 Tax=Portibacter lacus TaxID=1099794 RepID=A0AA37SMJ1_9BACT|nr:phosphatase domain-containing protein [Portibacter lacus]GLR15546.1 hypothetical protein GCM10007940_01610 [Portibacter lacus]